MDWLILGLMPNEVKDELVEVLCHELNQLKESLNSSMKYIDGK